jgi:hypothetical protein
VNLERLDSQPLLRSGARDPSPGQGAELEYRHRNRRAPNRSLEHGTQMKSGNRLEPELWKRFTKYTGTSCRARRPEP